jgi:acyl transferase domain-containing protein
MTDKALTEAFRRSVKEIERLRRENADLQAARAEPVAIVSMACRLPGGVFSPQALWGLLDRGADATSDLPADRGWDLETLYDSEALRPGTCYARRGGFLDRPGDFDAAFFNIAPREALALDPQQRLLLETAWEALEGAGILSQAAREATTGVFAGLLHQDYLPGLDHVPAELSGYAMTGSLNSVAAGRISYAFGLSGPTLTVDTACSSSLVAVHLAVRALRAGECGLALAGGATVMATPGILTGFSRQRALARDGRCKSFAEGADGLGVAEGAGMVLLARLSDARRRGYPVLAVIRGSAINSDGASNGLTAPSGPAQEEVIRAALADAGLRASDIDAVEAHGTGTSLGDPIEAEAILASYGAGRPLGEPLWLGSLKSNLGHTNAAAGVAGLIKMVLALQAGVLPRTLHAERPSGHVDWTAGNVRLLSEPQPWAAGTRGRPRRAGISAFGISGTNAHVVLEEAPDISVPASRPAEQGAEGPGDQRAPVLLPFALSAKSRSSLQAQAQRLREHLTAHPAVRLLDVAYSLVTTRTAFSERATVIAGTRPELLAGLASVAAGESADHMLYQPPGGQADAPAAVVALARSFTGGGAPEWGTMFAGYAPRTTRLPTYAFDRKRYWWHRPQVPALRGPEEARADTTAGPTQGSGQPRSADRIAALVRSHLAEVTGKEAAESGLADSTTFADLGLNSVGLLDLHRSLVDSTGLTFAATAIFDHPTPGALSAFLCSLLADAGPGDDAPAMTQPLAATARSRPDAVADDLIAVVGMACRLPGAVRSPEDLWDLVCEGRDAIGAFPVDRGWDLRDLYDPDPDHAGTSYTRHGGFLDDVAGFDAPFFAIGPKEALAMDPQQRLLLELSWEAVERARIDPSRLRGTRTGTFVGLAARDYRAWPGEREDAADMEGYEATGLAASVASGRIAYALGLEGPALTVDTACSSSLVAMQLACRSLRAGECSLALAGGATVLATADAFVQFSRQRGLAPDGRCKSFSDDADGTAWGEGAGMLLLERADDALRLGHPVLALVRGIAVNSDGASNGLTAPSGTAQQRLIRAALADAGLSAADVDLVEAHGTGTRLGDPVEAVAVLATYGQRGHAAEPVRLGSLKSNIGHTMAAAGVSGIIKSVLALRHGVLPKSLHADRPSSQVDWSGGSVRLLAEAEPWPQTGRPRRAAVSAFGMSGTNAHIVLEQAPDADLPAAGPSREGSSRAGLAAALPCPVSAATASALSVQALRLHEFAAARPDLGVPEIGWSLASTRAAMRHRAVVFARDRGELLAGLLALARGEQPGLPSGPPPDAAAIAAAYTDGAAVDWTTVFGPAVRQVDLPVYAFQHQRYWNTPPHPQPPRSQVQQAASAHILASPPGEPHPSMQPTGQEDLQERLLTRILDGTAELLGRDVADIDADAGFFQLGLDSLQAVRLRRRLEEAVGRSLSTAVLFDHPTAESLAAHLAQSAAERPREPASPARTATPAAVARPGPAGPVPSPESLPEEDLLRLLNAEIAAAQAVRTNGGAWL